MKGRFEGKVVIVTGAASGIGRAAAIRFGEEGGAVVAVDVDTAGVEETVELIEESGAEGLPVSADVTCEADVARYVTEARVRFGGVDVLFNNAGVLGEMVPLTRYEEAAFDRVIAVNVKGVWLGMKHTAREISARGGGAIINTASVAGLSGNGLAIAYVASKHAIVGMTKVAALELASRKIRVNALCPAPVETAMGRLLEETANPDDPAAVHDLIVSRIPLGRYGEPGDVAALAAFLASDDAAYITGAAVPVDGGMLARFM